MFYKAVLFDLDGTLLNTIEDIADSMNFVLNHYGFPTHSQESYKIFIGAGIENLIRQALPDNHRDNATIDKCLEALREEYKKRCLDKTYPYKGIPELLDSLSTQKIKMAILSNKPDDMTKLIVSKLLGKWKFEEVMGEMTSFPRKPDPTSAKEIARRLEIQPQMFLYLGDTAIDMKTAIAAEMYPVGALWGFRPAEELIANGAKKLIKKPEELLNLL